MPPIAILLFLSLVGLAASPLTQARAIAAQSGQSQLSPQPAANPDLRGVWRGRYADSDTAELTVERQEGSAFFGTISVTTKAGKEPSELRIEGRVSGQTVEIREIAIVKLGAARDWRLGTGSGLLQPDGQQMIGIGKDVKSSFGWDFTRVTTSLGAVDVAAAVDLRGRWSGTYSGLPAQLTIDVQDGSRFSGTLVLTAKRGKAPSEAEIEGSVSGNAITLWETKLLKLGAAEDWNLGRCSGIVRQGGQQMSGEGKDRDGTYLWSFTRE